jgi:hypothetical protein
MGKLARCLGLLAAMAAPALGGAAPAEPRPAPLSALRPSADGRSLADETGKPVFLLADTAWGLAQRLNRAQAEAYLRQRRAQRFNAVTFVLFVPGKNEITPGLANVYGHEPFARHGSTPDPTQPLTTPGSDPADPVAYDYWDHVDFLVRLTRQLGLYAIILPTWGSGVVGSYDGKSRDGVVFDAANARSYGRWVATRYRDEPHVLWMLGGDRAAVEGAVDYRPVFRAMAAGLGEGAPGKLVSYHPRKGAPQSGAFFHEEPWLAFNSIQEWPDRQLVRLAEDWARTPVKPTWLFEGRYEGYFRGNYKAEDWGEWQVRQQAYQTVLAGAFGHTYGHERVFGFGTDGVDWTQHLDTPGARSMTHLAQLMETLAAFAGSRVPDQTLVDGDAGKAERTRSDRISAARSAGGEVALFYSASGRPIRVRCAALAPGPASAAWFNPRSGHWHVDGVETATLRYFAQEIPRGPGSPVREFTPPSNGPGQDWLLLLAASSRR